jgi:putative chitinase
MSLETLQSKSGVTPDGKMGPNTFNAAAKYLGIKTQRMAIHFFAQCEHETGHFKHFVENLNYSAKGLRATWPKRFDEATSIEYARQPERIANRVYANRLGNGDEASGDGWKFRGVGALMTTGRYNMQKLSVYVDDHTIMQDPTPVSNEYAFHSAMFFFKEKNLWDICNKGTSKDIVTEVSEVINGGHIGLQERIELTNKYAQYRWDT